MLEKLHRNIRLIYGLAFFNSFVVIVPVIVPFFMSKGLSLAEIFYLQAVFACTIVLLEAPSGYVADIFGRRRCLVFGAVIHGIAFLYLNFADELGSLILFEILAGIAASLLSGADLALLYDSHKALEQDANCEHSRGIANLGFIRSGAEGLGALFGGLLAIWSFDLIVLVQSIAAWACLLMAIMVVEPPLENSGEMQSRVQIGAILRHLFRSDPVLRCVVLAIPLYSVVTFHAAWLMQPYWEDQGIPLALFGLLWCSQSLMVALANKFGFEIERRYGALSTLALIAALPVVGHFGMAWLQGWAGIAVGLLLFASRGLTQVILVNALNRRVPSAFRATANSFTSFLFRLAFIVTGPVVGTIAESRGLQAALILLGLSSLLLFAVVMLPLMQSVKSIQQRVAA